MRKISTFLILLFFNLSVFSQDYFYEKQGPFDKKIPSPEEFLGYAIGEYHTRHDRVVSYFKKLAQLSDKATLTVYGKTHENRELIMLNISNATNIKNLEALRIQHIELVDTDKPLPDVSKMPVFINLAYNVHGNEPSSTEAAMLTAYTLIASQNSDVVSYLDNALVFIDPTINPDGRDRHTHWANTRRGDPLVADKYDIEHNEPNPNGRTNHYWFDLNRDWLLGVHPESQGKLNWYHQWYPNVVTDFHEMGTNSTYFFEPMKPIGSKDPIMPKENYTTLNDLFAKQFTKDLNAIGSLYFTKEAFDGTYPGYGSSYPDLQGALALLFEQASSRGHLQETETGAISFKFTIRNQYVSSFATIKAAIEHKNYLHEYERRFFTSALAKADKSYIKGYVFGDEHDNNRTKKFIDFLLMHKIEVYNLQKSVRLNNKLFKQGKAFLVPTKQKQYRMVQTMFETYSQYKDSVYYDASAWSVANFYNMPYNKASNAVKRGAKVTDTKDFIKLNVLQKSNYAYLIPWDDYNAPAVLYKLQQKGVKLKSSLKPFAIAGNQYASGTLLIPVSLQKMNVNELFELVQSVSTEYQVSAYNVNTGFSEKGIDLGSRNFATVKKPKPLMLIGTDVSSYEAGEVWHLLDTKLKMPLTKAPLRIFNRIDLNRYNTLILVSGRYNQLDSLQRKKIKDWVSKGNTLITTREASAWVINKKIVKEALIKKTKDSTKVVQRLPYGDAGEHIGRERVGGAVFEVDLDVTNPIGFGYHRKKLPVYRNSNVWLEPSKNPYATVAKYTKNPHIDGYISEDNMNSYLKKSASIIVSQVGQGRAILFADNPNFRGSWYGTNKLFFNALFFGSQINIPK